MSVTNSEIAGACERPADLFEIENALPFRVRAHRNAAQTVQWQSRSVAERFWPGADLTAI